MESDEEKIKKKEKTKRLDEDQIAPADVVHLEAHGIPVSSERLFSQTKYPHGHAVPTLIGGIICT